ncbi:MAG: S41 family peptidase [Actinomycetia bacterium]|nr:S41 family peptidase [Actinomycetes bacterium]
MDRKLIDILVVLFLVCLIVILSFTGGYFYGIYSSGHNMAVEDGKEDTVSFDLIEEVMDIVEKNYVGSVEKEELIIGAAKGVVDSLDDPYSHYLNKDHFQSFQEETAGYFYGIGIYIGMKDVHPVVISPIEGTPAEEAGLESGDIIIKVDGTETENTPLESVIKMIKGEEGTKVTLTIAREGEKKPFDVDIVRAKVVIPNTAKKVIEGDIGYLRLHSFTQSSGKEIQEALEELLKDDIKGLVLDVRNNPGGLLEEAVFIASLFIEEGTIVSVKEREGEEEIWEASRGVHGISKVYDLPLVILVNGGSASASEILAGALKDYERAVLVGEKTFGKASVQNMMPLSNKEAIILTTAKYYTPNGTSIHEKGIEPNVEIKFEPHETDEEEEEVENGEDIVDIEKDNQLKKAVEILKEQI